MPHPGILKPFLLFVAATASDRKNYIASFPSLEKAVEEAARLKSSQATRWQVLDKETAKVLAEDPGSEASPPASVAVQRG